MKDLTMEHTKKALAVYNETVAERKRMMDLCRTEHDIFLWRLADRVALQSVQYAFYRDTKDRNSLDGCLNGTGVPLDFIEKMVEDFG